VEIVKKGKYNQARCDACDGWHFTLNGNEIGDIVEYKCCKCGALYPVVKHHNIVLLTRTLITDKKA
jgi:PHP family Zn ribbon phosphoesterase